VTGETCGAEHPEQSGTLCTREPHQNQGFHAERHTNTVWPADPVPTVQGRGRAAAAAIAARTKRHHPTGPASEAVRIWRDRHGDSPQAREDHHRQP
jgi:hypothetical protein